MSQQELRVCTISVPQRLEATEGFDSERAVDIRERERKEAYKEKSL